MTRSLKKQLDRVVLSTEAAQRLDEWLDTLRTSFRRIEYGTAIWLQVYLGLRVGEIQALTWNNVDLQDGTIHIRRAYVRKDRVFKDYPKGRKQHSHRIPPEVVEILLEAKGKAKSSYVAESAEGGMLSYEWYFRSPKRYCRECGLEAVGTHGLRHSTAGLYLSHGASRDDIKSLFAHSSYEVTDRYIHHRESNLEKVAGVIRLFPNLPKIFPLGTIGEISRAWPQSQAL